MSTINKQEAAATDVEVLSEKPVRRIIEPGMASGTGSGFAMPVTILRNA